MDFGSREPPWQQPWVDTTQVHHTHCLLCLEGDLDPLQPDCSEFFLLERLCGERDGLLDLERSRCLWGTLSWGAGELRDLWLCSESLTWNSKAFFKRDVSKQQHEATEETSDQPKRRKVRVDSSHFLDFY